MTQHSFAAGRRTSWLPPVSLIGAKLLELRKRRTLMTVTVAFTVALPVIFYGIRLAYHLGDPARYAQAGAPNAFATAGTLMDEFGFIVAVALGATAGTADLTDGMFRHLVITGRSRLALYLARIPAGLSILLSLAAAGFTVACLVTAFLSSPQAAGAVTPSPGAMAGAGLWLELDLIIGFTVGLGLGSLMGQRTVPVILLIVLEIIITPALAGHVLPHFLGGELGNVRAGPLRVGRAPRQQREARYRLQREEAGHRDAGQVAGGRAVDDAAVDHTQPDWADQMRLAAPDGVDVILEAVGGEMLHKSIGLLAPFGRAVSATAPTVGSMLAGTITRSTGSGTATSVRSSARSGRTPTPR